MRHYYRDRSPVYDEVYAYPERQNDLRYLAAKIPFLLAKRHVLEIAAGTGYWTEVISQSADHILATDREVMQLDKIAARVLCCDVEVQEADAYRLKEAIHGSFSGAFAGLWLSHVPRQHVEGFLSSLHERLEPGARVVLLDNALTQCNRFPIAFTDDYGNTYQDRMLDQGKTYSVLKNFPTREELVSWSGAGDSEYRLLENYWLYHYIL